MVKINYSSIKINFINKKNKIFTHKCSFPCKKSFSPTWRQQIQHTIQCQNASSIGFSVVKCWKNRGKIIFIYIAKIAHLWPKRRWKSLKLDENKRRPLRMQKFHLDMPNRSFQWHSQCPWKASIYSRIGPTIWVLTLHRGKGNKWAEICWRNIMVN